MKNRQLKKLFTLFGYSFVAIATILFCIVFTIPGNKAIAWVVNHTVSGITISQLESRFYDDEPFALSYHSEELDLELTDLAIDLSPRGIVNWKIRAKLGEGSVTIRNSQAAQSSENSLNESASVITLPNVFLDLNVLVEKFNYADQNNELQIKHTEFEASIKQSEVNIKRINIADIALQQNKKPDEPEQTRFIKVPKLELPSSLPIAFDVFLSTASVEQIRVTSNSENGEVSPLVIRSVKANIALKDNVASVKNASLSIDDASISMSGSGSLSMVDFHTQIKGNGHTLTADLQGPWNAVNLSLTSEANHQGMLHARVNPLEDNWPFQAKLNFGTWQDLPFITLPELSSLTGTVELEGKVDGYQGNANLSAVHEKLGDLSLQTAFSGSLTQFSSAETVIVSDFVNAKVNFSLGVDKGLSLEGGIQWQNLRVAKFVPYQTDLSGHMAFQLITSDKGYSINVNDFSTEGNAEGLPLDAKLSASVNENFDVNIRSLDATLGQSKVALSGLVADKLDIKGDWDIDLSPTTALPYTLIGKGSLKVNGTRVLPRLFLDATFTQMSSPDFELNDVVAFVDFNEKGKEALNVRFETHNGVVQDIKIDSVTAHALGTLKEHNIDIKVQTELGGLNSSIAGKYLSNRWSAKLSQSVLKLNGHNFIQSETANLMVAKEGDFTVSPLCFKSEKDTFCLDSKRDSAAQLFNANVKLDDINLAIVKDFMPKDINILGHLSGKASYQAKGNQETSLLATLTSENTTVLVSQEGILNAVDFGTIDLDVKGSGAKINVQLQNKLSPLGHVFANIETQLGQTKPSLNAELVLNGINLGYLDPMLTQLLNREFKLQGDLSGDVKVQGEMESPQFFGDLRVTGLAAQNERSPVKLNDSELAINLNGQSMQVHGALKDLEAGTLNLDGDVNWQDTLNLAMRVNGKSFWLRPQEGVEFKVDTDVRLDWTGDQATLQGNVTVPYGRIAIKSLPEDAIAVSSDQVFVDEAELETESLPVKYDISLQVAVVDDVKIDSFGLKSYLNGSLLINKQNDTPLVGSGELSLVQGQFRAFGQDLIISKGQVGFSGALDKPFLHVNAIRNPQTTQDGVIAGVQLTGLATEPELTVYSEPAMDQAQALSYLLNGRPLGGDDADKSVLLANLLISQGLGRSEGLLQKVGSGVGLQDVNVGTKGSGVDTQVELTGFLTPSVQVRYSVGVFDSLSEIAVRYQIMSKLYVEITSGLYNSIDLLYRFDWE
ncbi:translocation/assembly module TamB domain-containing protein [Pseudoalteromonas xiamenensis]|uniref:translocation/assembly module TamB domain-containing protein n=1 Tax=Pseudoalteromonas xiamenensis TaxID=882626 RepID=UPI0027E4221F|nr:translocation/assembly module TamB domain-containing protein [Pseudoalteromonas xiamenensis]WMN59748.1 translocation/assembly module TamB domain-containing protein [Pseudoalteromonas xiamenensis]